MNNNRILSKENAFYPHIPPISLELTSRCNLKCPYCANSVLTRNRGYIEWTLLEKIVKESSDGHHNIAALHGTGEPLLWDKLEEVIRLIKTRNAGDASFATNGTLLSGDRIRRLLDAGLTSIRVSLDSMDEKIYKETRGGNVLKVIENIQTLINLTPNAFEITLVLMNHKTQHITERHIVQFHKTFGFHQKVKLEIVNNGLIPSSPQDFRETPIKVSSCLRPSEWFTITSEGKVSICCSDQNAHGIIGDVNQQTIDEIWYASQNQATFKHIALGRFPCPQVCTSLCWLEIPTEIQAGDVNLGYELPFKEALKIVEQNFLNQNFTHANQIVNALLHRDPSNQEVQYWLNLLIPMLKIVEENVYKQAAEERLEVIKQLNTALAIKDDIIQLQVQELASKEAAIQQLT